MEILIRDPPPDDWAALLERRHRLGNDRHDEVWAGVYHVNPAPTMAHGLMCKQLLLLLDPLAAAVGLVATGEFNLGHKGDHRIPDLGLHRDPSMGVWHETAALVVEVLSPHDETFQKLPFYAQHRVREVVIVDPAMRRVQWLALHEGDYAPLERSALVALGAGELAALIEWRTEGSPRTH